MGEQLKKGKKRKRETLGDRRGDGRKKADVGWMVEPLCVYVGETEKERGSGVPPAAVCRLGVHGG